MRPAFTFVLAFGLFACDLDPQPLAGLQPLPSSQQALGRGADFDRVLVALTRTGIPSAREALGSLFDLHPSDLSRRWNRLGPALSDALRAGRLVADEELVEWFVRLGPNARGLLGLCLRAESDPVRELAAKRLLQAEDEGLQILLSAIREGVQEKEKLAKMVLEHLEGRVEQGDPRVRVHAAQMLWLLAEALAPALAANDQLSVVPPAMSGTLARLRELSSDPDSAVRITAIESLAELGPRARGCATLVAARMHDPERGVALVAGEVIHKFGPEALGVLLPQLGSTKAELRRDVVAALGRLGHELNGEGLGLVTRALISRSNDPDSSVRRACMDALAGLPPAPSIEDCLARALTDRDPEMRLRAVELLRARSDGRSAVDALSSVLVSDDEPLVLAALDGLSAHRRQARPALVAIEHVIEKGSPAVRLRGLVVFLRLRITSLRMAKVLEERLIDPDPRVRALAVRALGDEAPPAYPHRSGERKIKALMKRLASMSDAEPDLGVRTAIGRTLTKFEVDIEARRRMRP